MRETRTKPFRTWSMLLLTGVLAGTPIASASANGELARAKALADRMVTVIEANRDADPEVLKQQLVSLAKSESFQTLTKADKEELNRYVQSIAAPVKPTLDGLDAHLRRSTTAQLTGATCYTSCIAFIQFECGTDRPFGACIGEWWDCEDQRGGHLCLGEAGGDVGENPHCKSDGDCPPGYGCATWAFKANECVEKCESDSDCPSSQKCKKPIGTSFKRCK